MSRSVMRKTSGLLLVIISITMLIMPQSTYSINSNDTATGTDHTVRNSTSIQKTAMKSEQPVLANNVSTQSKEMTTISHKIIAKRTDEFMNKLVQKAGPNNKVKAYDSKNELIQSFQSISTTALAKEYVDFYYKEYNNGLYIVPTETPPWFNKEKQYQTKQIDNKHVMVIQENQSEMHGNYTIEIEFAYQDNQWKMINVNHK
ncbi:hypothetical protein [Pontibacillus yanchengensis]|uniref:Uncharacterized protein n=1 Tax=Pontibacillus yanchengensis Y32 TaxID=1385514 RepID=A0A0A2T918_9BACI|nr:hypothetical protein [Pontibacillus yanchengensis]KGP70883.1 hypothetical protein N782_03585 [Pontibacillus yanchengensis Y32]